MLQSMRNVYIVKPKLTWPKPTKQQGAAEGGDRGADKGGYQSMVNI